LTDLTYRVFRDVEAVDQTCNGDPDVIMANGIAEAYSPSYYMIYGIRQVMSTGLGRELTSSKLPMALQRIIEIPI